METCEVTCKLCNKDLFEEQKKQTSRTVSSFHSDLFELTVELGGVYTTMILMNTVTLVFVFTEEMQRLHEVVFGRLISGS